MGKTLGSHGRRSEGKAQLWRGRIEAWRRSDLTQTAYCRHGFLRGFKDGFQHWLPGLPGHPQSVKARE